MKTILVLLITLISGALGFDTTDAKPPLRPESTATATPLASTTTVVTTTTQPTATENTVVALIHKHFGSAAPRAIQVFTCESGLDPNAKSPTNDHGVAQIHAPLWVATFEAVTGVPFYNGVYNADLNLQFAKYLYDQSGWAPWYCA